MIFRDLPDIKYGVGRLNWEDEGVRDHILVTKKWGPERGIMKNLLVLKFVVEMALGIKTPRIVTTSANILFVGVKVGSNSGAMAHHLIIAPAVIAINDRFNVGVWINRSLSLRGAWGRDNLGDRVTAIKNRVL